MKAFLLTAFLGGSLAAAQTTSTPSTSVAPAATVSDAPVLTLNAPVGTVTELVSTTTTRMTVSDVSVTAAPGSKVTPAQVEEARRSIVQGTEALKKAGANTVTAKIFNKVTARDAAGNTTLLSTVVQPLPAAGKQPARNLNIRFTQVIAPDGKISGMKVESDDAQVNRILQGFTPDRIQQMAEQNGNNFTGVYGRPLVTGQSYTNTTTMNMQELLGGIFSLMAGPQGAQAFGDVQASPLKVTTTMTSRGQNARGETLLEGRSTFDSWKVSVNSKDADLPMQMSVTLLDAVQVSNTTYAQTGLPVNSKLNSTMKMNLVMVMDGVQVSMNMNMEQSQNVRPR